MFHSDLRRGFAAPAVIGIILALIAALGIGVGLSRPGGYLGKEKGKTIMVALAELNGSGQSGKAEILEAGGKVKVIVNLTGEPSDVPEPVHIHEGSCPNPGAVKYPLTSVSAGASQTELAATFADLEAALPLSINVHKSASELSVYVACGDITTDMMARMMGDKGKNEMMDEDDDGEMMDKGKDGGTMMDKGEKMMGGKTHTIEITAAGFKPATLTIEKGDMVEFINRDNAPHWPATAMHPSHEVYPGSSIGKCNTPAEATIFDACRGIAKSAKWPFTFQEVGSWNYHDHLNSKLFGKIVVKDGGTMMGQ